MTLNLGVVSLSPTLAVEITEKIFKKKKTSKSKGVADYSFNLELEIICSICLHYKSGLNTFKLKTNKNDMFFFQFITSLILSL